MEKKIGVLAAVAFVLGTQGVTAASISPSRLEELMASTSQQAVSLETLRARDRVILEKLATSLANRYSDLLAGSELVFTRLSEAGSVFYRLDFVNLQNRDRARALCEILEMERCVARVGDDRLSVLHVQAGRTVTAITVVEEEEAPFSFFGRSEEPEANPVAKDVERRVRAMLDPLEVFPEPRPDFSKMMQNVGLEAVEAEIVLEAPSAFAEEPGMEGLSGQVSVVSPETSVLTEDEPGYDQPQWEPVRPDVTVEGMDISSPEEGPYEAQPEVLSGVDLPAEEQATFDEGVAFDGPVDEPMDEFLDEPIEDQIEVHVDVVTDIETDVVPAEPMVEEGVMPDEVEQFDDEVTEVPALDEQAGLQVFPRSRDEALALVLTTTHPVPTLRPAIEVAEVQHPEPARRPEMLTKLSPVFPLARPALEDAAPRATADLAPAVQSRRAYVELADTGDFADLTAMSRKQLGRQQTAFSIPDAASLDFSSLSGLAPQVTPVQILAPKQATMTSPAAEGPSDASRDIAMAPADKTIAPEVLPVQTASYEGPVPLARDTALTKIAKGEKVAALKEVKEIPAPMSRDVALAAVAMRAPLGAERAPAPNPVLRDVALAEMRVRQEDKALQVAMVRGSAAPKPFLRTTAMARVSPKLDAEYMVAQMRAPLADTMDADLPGGIVAAAAPRSAPDLGGELENIDVAMSPPPVPERRPQFVAQKATQLASTERPRPAFGESDLVVAGMEVAQLGKVSFDDRFARPAHVDFADGEMAGRLQKLPLKRPDFAGREARASFVARMIREDGDFGAVAMTSTSGAFEVAQVPSLPTASEPSEEPFTLVEEPAGDRSSSLDMFFGEKSAAAPTPGAAEVQLDAFTLPKGPTVASEAAAEVAPPIEPGTSMKLRTMRPGMNDNSLENMRSGSLIEPPAPAVQEPIVDQASLEAEIELRKLVEEQERQRQVIAVMSEIIAQRDAAQPSEEQAAPVAPPAPAVAVEAKSVQKPAAAEAEAHATAQRRPAPRGPLDVNQDKSAARELAGYEAGFSDDRSKMQKAAHPQGQPSAVQLREQGRAMDMAQYQGLRIELSYVSSRQEVMSRVAELKTFFPAIMLEKGRFFGASVPEQPHRYMVGFAAENEKARDDVIWYLEQMGMPWAIR